MAEEEAQRLKSESLLAQLEKEEMELIKRLQYAQKEQSLVYEEMSTILPATPPGISSAKSTPSLSSSRMSPDTSRIASSSVRGPPRVHYAPTLASLSRRDIGGAALR